MMAVRLPDPPRRRLRARRSALLLGCALGAASLALADRAQAQAFEGTPGTQAGSVTYNRANPLGPGTETLTINSAGAVVLWAPNASGGTQSFLPGGRLARFQGAPGNPNFVVLNRIVPNAATIYQFDGTVISQASATDATRSGTVLFYTPGGIILGSTAVFDVGSLVLTTLDVGFDATGNIFQPGGVIQFRSGRLAPGAIETRAGSQIIANSEGSNIALVAPSITHAGSIRVNGSAAFVAAQSVDVAFNAGLFDIVVPAGGGTQAGGTVITHTGSTTGPASTGAGDNHRIYVAGVAEINAINMLLGGTIGYDASLVAGVQNGQIIISSGYDVTGGNPFEVINNGAPASTIISTGGTFTSDVNAIARSGIALTAFSSNLTFTGNLNALSRGQVVGLLAANGFNVSVGGNVSLLTTQLVRSIADPDSIGGTAVIQANAGSTIAIGGNASLDSSAVGLGLQDGSFVGRGGTVRVTGNGAVAITGGLSMNATGLGRDGGYGGTATINGSNAVTVGGNLGINAGGAALDNAVADNGGIGQGGTVNLTTTGSIVVSGTSTIAAAGIGGNVTNPSPLGPTTGGAGNGGTVNINTTGGTVDLGTLTGLAVFGRGGTAQTGGAGTGGALNVEVRGGIVDLGDNGALIVGDGTGGGGTANGGAGTGANVNMAIYSATAGSRLRGGLIAADLRGIGGAGGAAAGPGGAGRGGNFDLLIDAGNAAVNLNGITASANGTGGAGLSGGAGNGGRVQIAENALGTGTGPAAASTLGNLNLTATGTGGSGPAAGGNGQGGQVRLSAGPNPITGAGIAIGFGTALMDVSGTGGDGLRPAGNGTGGSVSLAAEGTGASLTGTSVTASANGRGGANPGFIVGGTGQGGTSTGMTATRSGAITLTGAASFSATGTGGASATGAGGAGTGGNATIEVLDWGSISVGGGTSATLSGTGGNGAAGGAGTGGTFFGSVRRTDAPPGALALNLGPTVSLIAAGTGGTGSAGPGGTGAGGTALLQVNSGGPSSELIAGAVTADVSATGGAGTTGGGGNGGTVRVAVDSGNARATFTGVTAAANGTGGAGTATAGNGTGGTIRLGHEVQRADGAGGGASLGALVLTANGTGGTGPTGGTGTGGTVTLTAYDAVAGSSIPMSFDTASMTASGTGGNGTTGGVGQGGTIMVTTGRNGVGLTGTSIAATANGTGGNATGGGGEAGGTGAGGVVTVTADTGGVLQLSGASSLTANGTGGNSASGTGGAGTGGRTRILASNGGQATTGNLALTVDGRGGNGVTGGVGRGGFSSNNPNLPFVGGAFVEAIGGTIAAGATTLSARGIGGAGTTGTGGAGFGGTTRILASRAATASAITLASAGLDVSAIGGAGATGGSAIGGSSARAQADVARATLTVTGNLAVNLDATGGAGSNGAGGAATGGTAQLGTYQDGAPIAPFAGSASFGGISGTANATGGAGTTTGGSATGGVLDLFANTANVQVGPSSLLANARGGTGGTGAGGQAEGGAIFLSALNARLTLTGQTTLGANAVAGAGVIPGTARGGLIEIAGISDGAPNLRGDIVAASIQGTANATGATPGNNVAGQWRLFASDGDLAFGALTLGASGDLAAVNPASSALASGGTISVSGAAALSSTGNVDVQANGTGQYLGAGSFTFTSAANVALTHANVAPNTPTFSVGGFAATAGGTFTTDAATIIRASNAINIAATGNVTVPGVLQGGSVTVRGAGVTLASVSGTNLDLGATGALAVTQASATGNIDFAAGGAANFGSGTAGGRFAGTAASLTLPSVTAAIVNVGATAGTAALGTVTGTTSLTATATGNLTFTQLNGGAVTLTSSGANITGGNITGSGAALAAGNGTITVASLTTTGNASFQAGGNATFNAVNAGGSFTGTAASLNLPNVTAAIVNVGATAGAATLGNVTGTASLTATATGNIGFNQLTGGAIALTSSAGQISGAIASGSSASFIAGATINVASLTTTGNAAFQAGGAATFNAVNAGGSFVGTAASLTLPSVTAAAVNVAATGGNAALGSVTGTTSLTAAASGAITFSQLNGGAIALSAGAAGITGGNANGASAGLTTTGAIDVGNVIMTGAVTFQATGAAAFDRIASSSLTGTATSLDLQDVTAATVNVAANAGAAVLGIVRSTNSMNVASTGNLSFNQLIGGAITLTSSAGSITGTSATGTNLLFDAAQLASFGGAIVGNDIRVTSRDIDIGTNARLGGANTQLVSLTARASGLQTVIGGTAQGPGYTLTDAEAGRIRTAQLAIQASANGTANNRAPDALLRDLTLSATPTTAGAGVNRLVVTLGGNAPAILQVEGAVRLANAGASDGVTITSPGRLQIVTPLGSVRVQSATGAPAGRVTFASSNIWSASQTLINLLIADANFAGRNAALLNNDGAFQPRGYIEAADVVFQVGSTAFVQNTGTVPVNFNDGNAYAGILVSRNTLTVTPTGTQPIQVYAFGRSVGADGSSSLNDVFFREVAFGRPFGQATSYTDASEVNQCVINTGACPLRIPASFDDPDGSEIIEGPIDGGDGILNPQAPNTDIIDTSFANEELIEEPVTSGAEANSWDCTDPEDLRCRREPRGDQ